MVFKNKKRALVSLGVNWTFRLEMLYGEIEGGAPFERCMHAARPQEESRLFRRFEQHFLLK